MGCGCGKGKSNQNSQQSQKVQAAKEISRTPQSRETYRKVLEEAAKGKEQKTA